MKPQLSVLPLLLAYSSCSLFSPIQLFLCILWAAFLKWFTTSHSSYPHIQVADMHQCYQTISKLVKYAWGEKKSYLNSSSSYHNFFWSFQMRVCLYLKKIHNPLCDSLHVLSIVIVLPNHLLFSEEHCPWDLVAFDTCGLVENNMLGFPPVSWIVTI